MKILICIKQINDSKDMNLFDAHALEEAVRLKQKFENIENRGFVSVDVVTVGHSQSSKIIRRAFGMGADRGYHIVTKDREYGFSFETASKLAVVAKRGLYDLILTGIMSQDLMSGQTGPMLAEIMGLPSVTGVVKINWTADNHSIEVEQEMENGFCNCLEVTLPALLTIQAGINTPGYPTLSKMLAAGKKEIITLTDAELFPDNIEPVQAREIYVSMETPQKTRRGHILEGSLREKVKQLYAVLHKKALI